MKLNVLRQEIKYVLEQLKQGHNIVPIYWGPPGVGKTVKIKTIADEFGMEVVDLLGSTMSPTDMVAFMPMEGSLHPFFNSMIPWEDKVGHQPIILFFDEADKTHPEVRKTMLKLINERQLNGKKLGPNVMIILAGNRVGDKAMAQAFDTALSNRLTHRNFTYDNDEYIDYISERYDVEELCAYLGWKPLSEEHFKLAISGKNEGGYTAWPNPRSVERVAQRFEWEKKNNVMHDPGFYAGDTGEGWAREFVSFLSILSDLPNVEKIKKDPDSVKVPNEVNKQYAITALLAQSVEKDCFSNYLKFITKLDIALQILFAKLLKRKPLLSSSKDYMDWLGNNKQLQKAVIG